MQMRRYRKRTEKPPIGGFFVRAFQASNPRSAFVMAKIHLIEGPVRAGKSTFREKVHSDPGFRYFS
jgi:hypothetical protein